jgi:hypothetical protein
MFEHDMHTLSPDSGHLVHMPSHIDVLCGHYTAAIEANERSQRADYKHLQWCTARGMPLRRQGFYTVCVFDAVLPFVLLVALALASCGR